MRHLKPIKHITPLSACPKCNIEWDRSQPNGWLKCPQCSMGYCYDKFETSHSLAMPDFLGKQGYNLFWYINKQQCSYGCLNDFVNDKEIRLPWLPYTITPQELTDLLAKPVMVHYLTPEQAAGIDEIDKEGTERLQEYLERNK